MTTKSFVLAGLTLIGMVAILWMGLPWWLAIPLALLIITIGIKTE